MMKSMIDLKSKTSRSRAQTVNDLGEVGARDSTLAQSVIEG